MTVRAQRPEVGTVAYQHWKTASAECRIEFYPLLRLLQSKPSSGASDC
jgi:hypothetical protein